MRHLIFSILILFCTLVKSQSLTLANLMKYNNMNFEYFETNLIANNWDPSSSAQETNDDFISKTFTKYAKIWKYISKTQYDDGRKKLYYTTSANSEYLSLLKQIKQSGFRYIRTYKQDNNNEIYSEYKNSESLILLSSSQFIGRKNSINKYTIILWRL